MVAVVFPKCTSHHLKQDPIIIPLFSKKAFWPPQDVPQLQNNVQLNNPPSLSLSLTPALPLSLSPAPPSPACRRSRWQIRSTCPRSRQKLAAVAPPCARAYLDCRRRAPRGDGRVGASLSGCRTVRSAAGKTTRATHTLGSVHPLSRAPLATDLLQLLPFPSFLYARSRFAARSPR